MSLEVMPVENINPMSTLISKVVFTALTSIKGFDNPERVVIVFNGDFSPNFGIVKIENHVRFSGLRVACSDKERNLTNDLVVISAIKVAVKTALECQGYKVRMPAQNARNELVFFLEE